VGSRRLHWFPDSERFGRALARALKISTSALDVHRFPDGESLVRARGPAGGHALVVRSLNDPNAKLVEVVLAADALRRAGARRVTLVAPYLPYMRQDRVFQPGESLSQRVVGRLLGEAFDAVLTMEAHLHRVQRLGEVVPGSARSLSAAPAIALWLRRRPKRTLLVGPDAESRRWVRAIAREADLRFVVGAKVRSGDRRVRVELPDLPAADRALIVDDIASSGATLGECARALRRRGIGTVDALVVHPLFAPRALSRIRRAGIRAIASCDSIPHPTNAVRVAPLFAAALARAGR
jgi:ribose-phosphate pyrophosphokinase